MAGKPYEVVLGPGARAVIARISLDSQKAALAHALRTELSSAAENSARKFGEYEAIPVVLSIGYTALVSKMTREELRRLKREQGRRVESAGWFVYDILAGGEAIMGPART